jgi:hypothetical protein
VGKGSLNRSGLDSRLTFTAYWGTDLAVCALNPSPFQLNAVSALFVSSNHNPVGSDGHELLNNQCGAVSPGNPIVVSIFLLGLCDMANNQSEKSLYTKSISWHCWAGYMWTWVAWCWPVSLPLSGCGYSDLGCMVLGIKLPNNTTTGFPMSIIMQLLRFVSTSSL